MGSHLFPFWNVKSAPKLGSWHNFTGVSGKTPEDVKLGMPSLKLTASLHLKTDGWNTILSYWGCLFSGARLLVSGRVCRK